jgi:regulator of replication initiation timing
MDDRDLKIEQLSDELEKAKNFNEQLIDELDVLRAEIDRIREALYDIYHTI